MKTGILKTILQWSFAFGVGILAWYGVYAFLMWYGAMVGALR